MAAAAHNYKPIKGYWTDFVQNGGNSSTAAFDKRSRTIITTNQTKQNSDLPEQIILEKDPIKLEAIMLLQKRTIEFVENLAKTDAERHEAIKLQQILAKIEANKAPLNTTEMETLMGAAKSRGGFRGMLDVEREITRLGMMPQKQNFAAQAA